MRLSHQKLLACLILLFGKASQRIVHCWCSVLLPSCNTARCVAGTPETQILKIQKVARRVTASCVDLNVSRPQRAPHKPGTMSSSDKKWARDAKFALGMSSIDGGCLPRSIHIVVGTRSLTHSVRESADFLFKSLHVARYWKQKVINPEFHPGTCRCTPSFSSLKVTSRVCQQHGVEQETFAWMKTAA